MRNNIYHMGAARINEVSSIAWKIGSGSGSADAKDRLWETVVKHPLTHTCGQLRQDFDAIRRHRVMVTGAIHSCLKVENYNVDQFGDYAQLVAQVPSVLSCVRSRVTTGRPLVRFHLNNNVMASVDQVRQDLDRPDWLRTSLLQLRALLREGSISRMRLDNAQFT